MLQKSRTTCTLRRSTALLGFPSAQLSMVRARYPAYKSGDLCSIRSVLPGILAVLSFQCVAALFKTANRRREGIRWWPVVYTVLMFSFATILIGTGQAVQFDCYIDDREYPGAEGGIIPGPLGYRFVLGPGTLLMIDTLMFQLSYWLADGFLVRCYLIPSPLAQVSNSNSPSSSIVVTRFSPRTSGPLPSPASCTSLPWVRV